MINSSPVRVRKKLIEVALPLEAINKAAAREKGNPFLKGHPRNLHQWWARRPATAARAVIFAQMVDDPSANPDLFPSEKVQEKERKRLFKIIEELVQWENTANEPVLQRARDEIWQSWRRTCADNADHARAKELFDRYKLPAFHDPFAGGGALPLEAQRLGLEAYASDLNPVAVLITKAMIEIPPRFAGKPPVNPESRRKLGSDSGSWKGAQGLADDVRYYAKWMRDEAEKRIGNLYPSIEITREMARERNDLKPLVGRKLTVTAWLWARTVKSPNPAFADIDVPLVTTFFLSTSPKKEAYIEPIVDEKGYRFLVKAGKPRDPIATKSGTKLSRGANFKCLMSGTPIDGDYIKTEGKAGRMGFRLMAIVADGERRKIYLSPDSAHEQIARQSKANWKPETHIAKDPRALWVILYGLTTWGDLFTSRQLVSLSTFSDLIIELRDRVRADAATVFPDDQMALRDGGGGASAYSEAIAMIEALVLDKLADYNNAICTWNPTNQNIGHLFSKQALPMAWDFPETSVLSGGLSFAAIAEGVAKTIEELPTAIAGESFQHDCAMPLTLRRDPVIATDPPYYDNIGYADLSDFFYVWLRRSLRPIFPDLFATVGTPKAEELVATPYRHGSKQKAERFFLEGMTKAMHRIAEQAHAAFPITIYYAFKQSESESDAGTASTGWETFLGAVIRAGFAITGTWPVRTERETRSVGQGTNVLASSIVLVCRKVTGGATTTTRRDFGAALKVELPRALAHLQASNIAPVDLAQAAIGPGMAVFTRYSRVLDAQGNDLSVREALALINETLDIALAEQEGDFDADSRWALAWFEQYGFNEGEFGVAETLSKAKNTSVGGIEDAGIARSKAGKVRLLKPNELDVDWDPETDERLTNWEMVHHLIRALESEGESAAAKIAAKLGTRAETARELCYRLYTLCERKKRATEALSYNALVQSWPEIMRLAKEKASAVPVQQELV